MANALKQDLGRAGQTNFVDAIGNDEDMDKGDDDKDWPGDGVEVRSKLSRGKNKKIQQYKLKREAKFETKDR